MKNKKFVTVDEAAKLANVAEITIRLWIHKGRLAPIKQCKKDNEGNDIGIRKYVFVKTSELMAIAKHRNQVIRATKEQLFEDSDGYLTVAQAAKLANIAMISLRKWIYRGKLKSYTKRSIDTEGKYIGVKKIIVVKESDVRQILNDANA